MIEKVFSGPYLRRLDNIKQWSEKDTLKTESVSQHSYKVAIYTTVILEEMLGKEELAERLQGFKLKCIQYAMFHDWDESLIKRDISHETKYNKWNGDEFRALLDRFSAHAAMLEFDQKYINGEVARKDVEKQYREVNPCQKLPLTRRVKKVKKRG